MVAPRRRKSALSALAQIACIGLPGDVVLDELLLILRDVVPFEGSTYVSYDDRGLAGETRPGIEVSQAIQAAHIARWFESGEHALYAPHLRERIARRRYDCLRMSHAVPRLRHTTYFDEILLPLGLVDEARVNLHDGQRLLGRLSIGRETVDFSDADLGSLRQALPHLTHAMARRPNTSPASEPDETTYGAQSTLLLVDRMGRILSSSREGWTLLHRAADRALAPGSMDDFSHAWAQPFLKRLVSSIDALRQGSSDQAPVLVERNRYGTFHLRGYLLTQADPGMPDIYGIQIERRVTLEQHLFATTRFRQLTERERQVCLRLVRGATLPQIAQTLDVLTSTAVYHVRNIYDKLGVHHRSQLIAALTAGARDS